MAYEELKQRQSKMWGNGPYQRVTETISDIHQIVVERLTPRAGDRWLDLACGTGAVAERACAAGSRVTGLDLTPELLDAGRAKAADAGVEIEWVEGDAEQLPFEDESFDVVVSTIGVMFAPDHGRAASELARVLRPGGRLGVASWTPDGTIGAFFKATAGHMPPPPEGFQPPPLWGTEAHVRELFDGTGVALRFEEADIKFDYESADEAIEVFESKFGPVVTAKRMLEPEGKWEALRADMHAMFVEQIDHAGPEGYRGQYLLALGTKES